MTKSFHELTTEEAENIACRIVQSSRSEYEIKRRLREAGFNGDSASIYSQGCGPMFEAMVEVYGPRGETIFV